VSRLQTEAYAEACARWWRYRCGAAGVDYGLAALQLKGETWADSAARLAGLAGEHRYWRIDPGELSELDSYWHTEEGPIPAIWERYVSGVL
jgi:hypothetical protein